MENSHLIQDLIEQSPNRRSFVRKLGVAGAAVAAAVSIDLPEAKAAGLTATDINVLNFALNLEFLEAEFYTVATTGKTLEQMGLSVGSNPGPTMGGAKVNFSNTSLFTPQIANEIAQDERTHVKLIQGLLGSAAVSKPAINLGALGFGYANQNEFLKLARIFEDIGVTAYAGAAPLLSAAAIGYAARILAAEAEHAANIRLQIARFNIPTAPPLDGVDILPPPSGRKYFSLDSNALAEIRNPGQVLYLAYGAGDVSSGGFFPDGTNGFFKTSSKSPA